MGKEQTLWGGSGAVVRSSRTRRFALPSFIVVHRNYRCLSPLSLQNTQEAEGPELAGSSASISDWYSLST